MQPMPDIAALIKIAQSPAGQKLLTILQAADGDLNQIASAAASGNLEEARQQLAGMLTTKDAQELLKQLEKQL